jgi:outer membrane protein assembly factor BamB
LAAVLSSILTILSSLPAKPLEAKFMHEHSLPRFSRLAALALLAAGFLTGTLRADDWPQWLGPQRDGVWREKGLLDKFPAAGPKRLWKTPIGEGYAGPAVADGFVYVFDRVRAKGAENPKSGFDKRQVEGKERILCLDQKTGDIVWSYDYDCTYQVSYGSGPRTTPIVSGGKVYTLGAMGHLVCLDARKGHKIWAKHLPTEYSMQVPMWGFAGHPLLDGNRLICLVGGNGSVAVAFDKDTGKELWKALSAKEPGYAPPMIYTFGGKRTLVLWSAESVNGLDPETGKVYWSQPFGSQKVGGGKVQVKAGMSIPTPRQIGDDLYVSCFYDGSLMLHINGNQPPTVLWTRTKPVVDPEPTETEQLHCVMSTPAIRDGHIYGICSYGELRCLDLKTGKRLWETYATTGGKALRWGNAFIVQLGDGSDRYILFNEMGELILCRLTPEKYIEISRAKIIEPTNKMAAGGFGGANRIVVWSHPAFANRCVYARNDSEIVCVSLAAE